eukprot:1019807-Ditylum_brightwellii.AAC.1
MEILVTLDKLSAFMKQGGCTIATDSSAGDDMISFVWKVVDVDSNAYFCHASTVLGKNHCLEQKNMEYCQCCVFLIDAWNTTC